MATTQNTIAGTPVPEGVILPPPEVRSIVEKTVGYVVRNGPTFEERIQQKEESNSKFSFLRFEDPYRAYYEWRLTERRNGGAEIEEDGGASNGTAKAAANLDDLPKPDPTEFSFKLPAMSAQDYDVIKLTALYVARNGNQLLKTISHREAKNFQFDFLKPTHSLFPIFNHLVEQYKKTISPSPALLQKVETGSVDPYSVINKARIRAEWQAHQLEEARKKSKQAEEERIAYAQIDWHDFVVVETIQFTDADNKVNLPPPISLAQLQFATLEQKKVGSLRIEEAPPDFVPEPPASLPARPIAAVREEQKEENIVEPPASDVPSVRDKEAEIEEQRIKERLEQRERRQQAKDINSGGIPDNMKIRSAGTSRLKSKLKKGAQQERMIKSQFTGEMIPESKYDEHVRITLLDPKWKEQKALSDFRQATSNLASTEAAATVKRLASELSGRNGDTDSNEDDEEGARKKQAREVQWDGYSRSKETVLAQAQASTSLKEQQEAHQRELERLNAIGPKKN